MFFAGVKAGVNNGVNDDVKKENQTLMTAGGRVLGALGMGADLEEARKQAYLHLGEVRFEGMQFRSDIAQGERKK